MWKTLLKKAALWVLSKLVEDYTHGKVTGQVLLADPAFVLDKSM